MKCRRCEAAVDNKLIKRHLFHCTKTTLTKFFQITPVYGGDDYFIASLCTHDYIIASNPFPLPQTVGIAVYTIIPKDGNAARYTRRFHGALWPIQNQAYHLDEIGWFVLRHTDHHTYCECLERE